MKIGAVIVGAGKGSRLRSEIPKALVPLNGKPLYQYSIDLFLANPRIREVVFVAPPDQSPALAGGRVVSGGENRQDSVLNGLKALSGDVDTVMIHDAARPFLTREIVDRLMVTLEGGKNCIAAVKVADTLKAGEGDRIVKTVDRQNLWQAQTPQCFKIADLKEAFERALAEGWVVTDEASLVERFGKPVYLVMGDVLNLKITTPNDLLLACSIVNLPGLKSRA